MKTIDKAPESLRTLAAIIAAIGPIGSVRVSSAQARGAAKAYSYWGAVRYRIGLDRDGLPCNRPTERATSDRRSIAGAERDAAKIARAELRVELRRLGRLTADDATMVLEWLAPPPAATSP